MPSMARAAVLKARSWAAISCSPPPPVSATSTWTRTPSGSSTGTTCTGRPSSSCGAAAGRHHTGFVQVADGGFGMVGQEVQEIAQVGEVFGGHVGVVEHDAYALGVGEDGWEAGSEMGLEYFATAGNVG